MVVARTIPVYNNRMEGVAQTQLSKRPELHLSLIHISEPTRPPNWRTLVQHA